ncbi:MAG: peroxide stress protein YaaA [Solirubrobacteraceae bacterium]
MIVLLAPSEGKTTPRQEAPPVDLDALAFLELTARREALVTRLERLAAGPRRKALSALGLSEAQASELDRDRDLLSAPAAPAGEVYTGVLYQHLDLPSLPAAAARRAAERLYVASALWGVVSIADRIPAYRLSMGATLPRIPNLARWWRPALASALPDDAFVVDLRSAAYAAAWRPARGTVVEVKASSDAGGLPRPISHMAKAVRGEVARLLVVERREPASPEEVAELVAAAGERVELRSPSKAGSTWTLEIVRG